MPIVNCCIEYIAYVQNSVVSGSGQFCQHNLNCIWRNKAANPTIVKYIITFQDLFCFSLEFEASETQIRILNLHKRWITFTYFGPQIRTVTNLFKHPNLPIAALTTNTITSLKQRHQKIMCGTIQPYLHHKPFKLRGPNLPENETTFSRAYAIYSKQKFTIGI